MVPDGVAVVPVSVTRDPLEAHSLLECLCRIQDSVLDAVLPGSFITVKSSTRTSIELRVQVPHAQTTCYDLLECLSQIFAGPGTVAPGLRGLHTSLLKRKEMKLAWLLLNFEDMLAERNDIFAGLSTREFAAVMHEILQTPEAACACESEMLDKEKLQEAIDWCSALAVRISLRVYVCVCVYECVCVCISVCVCVYMCLYAPVA